MRPAEAFSRISNRHSKFLGRECADPPTSGQAAARSGASWPEQGQGVGVGVIGPTRFGLAFLAVAQGWRMPQPRSGRAPAGAAARHAGRRQKAAKNPRDVCP